MCLCQMHSRSTPNQQLSMMDYTDVRTLCVLLFHMPRMAVAEAVGDMFKLVGLK